MIVVCGKLEYWECMFFSISVSTNCFVISFFSVQQNRDKYMVFHHGSTGCRLFDEVWQAMWAIMLWETILN